MSEVQITQYRATWDPVSHRGIIDLLLDGGAKKELRITDAAEFAALSTLLQLDPSVWLADDRLITTKGQPTGLRQSP